RRAFVPRGRGAPRPTRGHGREQDPGGVAPSARLTRRVGDHVGVDRELTRAELDELLPLFALDALDGEEREQVARYVERDQAARAEVLSLREAVAVLPPPDARAPESLWDTIERSLGEPAPPLRAVPTPTGASPRRRERRATH